MNSNFDFSKIPTTDVLRLLPHASAQHYSVLPFEIKNNKIFVLIADTTPIEDLQKIQMICGFPVLIYNIAPFQEVSEQIEYAYRTQGLAHQSHKSQALLSNLDKNNSRLNEVIQNSTPSTSKTLNINWENTPAVKLVNELLYEAIHSQASDIHFEPFEKEMKVRFREDGLLRIHRSIPKGLISEITSRIKIMAVLDIAEKRRPQDGRIKFEIDNRRIDLRVSTLPTDYGEKIVLRILDQSAKALNLSSLGMKNDHLEILEKTIHQPYGMILVTGPTGSGKTTSLYSALSSIRNPTLNISTIEDPIEYKIEGITQTAVKTEIGITFASALRTLLRQDPNVIMVGEIRDEETAQMAIRASLTGHLVFSTLHTNDSTSAISRLLDMGIEPFLLSSSLSLIIAQRLVRKICPHCREPITDNSSLSSMANFTHTPQSIHKKFFKGSGCKNCNNTGYSGRIGLFELLTITDELKSAISNKESNLRLKQIAQSNGFLSLREDGLDKVYSGQTSLEEILRETL